MLCMLPNILYFSMCMHVDRCCYYYHGVPKNVTCNLDGREITWWCQVYTPHEHNSNLSVKWYKRTPDILDCQESELTSAMSDRYTFSKTSSLTAFNNSENIINGLFLTVFRITINNFNSSSDNGYYWCQMVVNDSCLEPSRIGSINSVAFPAQNCSKSLTQFDFTHYEMPPVCAHKIQCIVKRLDTAGTAATTGNEQLLNSTSTGISDSTTMTINLIVILYVVTGTLTLIIALLLLVIMVFTVYTVRNCKANKDKQGGKMQTTPCTCVVVMNLSK